VRQAFALLVLIAVEVQVDDPQVLMSQGITAYHAKDYARAAELYEAAVEAARRAGVPAPRASYSAACCHALLGKNDKAFHWLNEALDAGWRNLEHLEADADLEALHADARWGRLLARCLDKVNESLQEPALREELLRRMKQDQQIRMTPNPDMSMWHRIDADNTAFMKTVIHKHGWPGKNMVGSDGALAAWLLVQHADNEVDFQKQCLDLLTKAVERNEAQPDHMAYLTDRVLVREGKPQRYGTQFSDTRFLGASGELKLQPLEDEANVDVRRKEVGLPPLAEYVKQMEQMQRP
jgi:tetratricopeptide (TPR) repeat protein